MQHATTKEITETIEKFCSKLVKFKKSDCKWNISTQREYIDALLSENNYSDNLTHFAEFLRNDTDGSFLVDGNNRSVTLLEYMNGASRLYWRVGKDKVVYSQKGNLKRGYRLMTEDERNKFLNTTLQITVYKYDTQKSKSRKRSLHEADLSNSNNSGKSSKIN